MKVSALSRYYFFSFVTLAIIWLVLSLMDVNFLDIVFFVTAFVWHFSLLAPGLKEKILATNQKYSFISVMVRVNHYLQLFINLKKVPHSSAFVRAISPFLFCLFLLVFGGCGNLLFTLLGSLCFEILYLVIRKYIGEAPSPLLHTDGPEIPPTIQHEEKTLE